MKKYFILITILFLGVKAKGQVNRYYEPAEFNYVPENTELLYKVGAAMQVRYDNNKEYRNNLMDWIFDIKSKTDDTQLLDAMDIYYSQLKAMDGENYGKLGNDLDRIKFNIKEEIDKYNTRLKNEPNQKYNNAVENLKNKNYVNAIREFSDLIESDRQCFQCFLGRGIAYYYTNNLPSSLNDLNKYFETKNDDPMAYYYRGWVKYYQKDFIGAVADFNKEVELKPSPTAYYDRGSAKSELGDNFGAISDYTKAIELKPDFSMAYNNRGWSKFKQKKYSDALIDLNKSIELDSDNWVAYDSRQETKFAMNDLKGCISDCNLAIWKNPKCANSYFFRGRANYKQGDKTKACEDWSKAGELGKAEAYDNIKKYCN